MAVRATLMRKIERAEARLRQLKEEAERIENAPKLTRDSEGMQELADRVSEVATKHRVKPAEVILLLSKIKRAGLVRKDQE
jgi:hypothetical protein